MLNEMNFIKIHEFIVYLKESKLVDITFQSQFTIIIMALAANEPWNLRKLLRVIGDPDDDSKTEEEHELARERCIQWCQEVGLLRSQRICPKKNLRGNRRGQICGAVLHPVKSSRSYRADWTSIGKRFRHRPKEHNEFEEAITKNSWYKFIFVSHF